MQLCFSASLVISSWWNSQISLTPTSHVSPRDKGSETHRIHRPHIRLPWFLITARRLGISDPGNGVQPPQGCLLNVKIQCWFPIVSALHSFVGKWNLGEFGPGPTCSKQTRSDWHFLEGHWDLLHFFSCGKGFLLSIRESWTVFVQAHHKFWINTLGQQRRKHIVLLQTLGINNISSCCTVSAIQNESNDMDHGFFKPFGSDISRGTQRGNPMEDTYWELKNEKDWL